MQHADTAGAFGGGLDLDQGPPAHEKSPGDGRFPMKHANIAGVSWSKVDPDQVPLVIAGRGFPQKQKLWSNKRYWPSVKAWFDHTYGLPDHVRGGLDLRREGERIREAVKNNLRLTSRQRELRDMYGIEPKTPEK
jgi:hypothetical protein